MSALRKSEERAVRLRVEDDLQTYTDTLAGHGPRQEALFEVEPDDDLTSVRTKLESTPVSRVVLRIPGDARILKEALEFRMLRLLQRELGLNLVLVVGDLHRRALAREAGFRNIFNSMKAYYQARDLLPSESEGAPFTITIQEDYAPAWSIGKSGILVGLLLVAAILAMGYLFVPVAAVVVYPRTETLTREVDVLVELGGPRIDPVAQRLSGRLVEERIQVQASLEVGGPPPQAPPPPANPGAAQQSQGLPPGTVTLEVRDALRNHLLQLASAQASTRLKSQVRNNESMPDASIQVQVVGERYDRNIGEPAEKLSGTMEVTATALVFNNDDFNRLVFSLWSQDIPRNYQALGNPDLSPPRIITVEGRHATLRTRAAGKIQRDVDADAVAAAVRGSTATEAEAVLGADDAFSAPPRITFWPEWADRAYRVEVRSAVGQPSGS